MTSRLNSFDEDRTRREVKNDLGGRGIRYNALRREGLKNRSTSKEKAKPNIAVCFPAFAKPLKYDGNSLIGLSQGVLSQP